MKKKWLSLALSLCLGLGAVCAPVPGEALPVEEELFVPLPEVGDVVNGFEVVQIRDFPMAASTVVCFEHQRTGGQLYYVANEDTNRAFALSFFTRAIDNTGLPHVFEHATLSGSEKYPSKALFMNLSFQTYNTFMNAFTMQNMTMYPFSSLSEPQLLKLADYYVDSCFHPMIMEDESIYRREAWRYRLENKEDPLTIEGTVYSEMLGALTLQSMASYNAIRTALPGSLSGFVSGGDPQDIPDMTYEALKSYHDYYYHPSNSLALLYGSFEDYTAFLALLDEAYAPYEKKEFSFEEPDYVPLTEPVSASFPFASEEGSNTENASTICYSFVCPGAKDNFQDYLVLNVLSNLLGASASELSLELQKALPAASFSCSADPNGAEVLMTFSLTNANPGDEAVLKETVDSYLAKAAEKSLPEDLVDALAANIELAILNGMEGSQANINAIQSLAVFQSYFMDQPLGYLDFVDSLEHIKEWNEDGTLKDAVSRYLAGNPLNALTVTYPEPGLKEQQADELAARLEEVKASMSEEELDALVKSSTAPEEEEDCSAMVASLSAETVQTLPEEYPMVDLTDETDENGIRFIHAAAGIDGFGQPMLWWNTSSLPQEDIHWLHLFLDMIGEVDTDEHSWEELVLQTGRYLSGADLRARAGGLEFTPWLYVSWTALNEDLQAGYDLVKETLYHSRFDDADRLAELLSQKKASLRSGINADPLNVAAIRALSRDSETYRYINYYNYLDYYAFLGQAEELLAADPEAFAAKLQGIQSYLFNKAGLTACFLGNEESLAFNKEALHSFLEEMPSEEREALVYDLPVPADREAVILETGANFNVVASGLERLGLEYSADWDVMSALVQDSLLLPVLRNQYGAYGAYQSVIQDEGMFLYTYRDPGIAQTYAYYDSLPEELAKLPVTQEFLDGYILSNYSYLATSMGPLTTAANAVTNYLYDHDQSETLEMMQDLKAMTPEKVSEMTGVYETLLAEGNRMTAGSAAAINAAADSFDVILNPFGAQDLSQADLSDVAEGDPAYEAVRFVFEQGLMAPASGDAFEPDAAATQGDLFSAMYVLLGGSLGDPQAALDTFAGYSLADPATDLTAPVSSADFFGLLSALAGSEMPDTAEIPELTRADLAGLLFTAMQGA